MKIRVFVEDTDAGGIVYHSNYFKYCERARSEALWSNGFSVVDGDCGFVVKSIKDAEFIKPAKLGDILEVKTSLVSSKKTSFVLKHEIFRGDELIFKTDMLIVYICSGRPVKVEQGVMELLNRGLIP